MTVFWHISIFLIIMFVTWDGSLFIYNEIVHEYTEGYKEK